MTINTKSDAIIYLESGEYFYGTFCGFSEPFQGELCFNTAMTGYQEAISDPSYAGQVLVFSFPHIGIVGANDEDEESENPLLRGVILNRIEAVNSNFRAQESLDNWLKRKKISGVCDVDTRLIIRIVRESSKPVRVFVRPYTVAQHTSILQNLKAFIKDVDFITTSDYLKEKPFPKTPTPSKSREHITHKPPMRVAVIDFGLKDGIIRNLKMRRCEVSIFSPKDVIQNINTFHPDGIVLSNGPGNPQFIFKAYQSFLSDILKLKIPILGICMGYQLLALHFGAKTNQLSHAHHGINHPVKKLSTGKVYITSQNHEFHVDQSSLPSCIEPTHISLFDGTLEGFKITEKSIYAVQFHPEGSPGPQDSSDVFDTFLEECEQNAQKN